MPARISSKLGSGRAWSVARGRAPLAPTPLAAVRYDARHYTSRGRRSWGRYGTGGHGLTFDVPRDETVLACAVGAPLPETVPGTSLCRKKKEGLKLVLEKSKNLKKLNLTTETKKKKRDGAPGLKPPVVLNSTCFHIARAVWQP